MKRRSRSCLFGLILLLALSLCGCGEKEKEPVTITVIHAWGGTGEDHVAMRDIYDGFQKENPDIEINFEDAFATDFNEKGDYLRILTTHLEILTVDKRAMYIMALEIAKVIDGQISEDNKKTWLTVEEFRKKHEAILSLTFEEANERSLTEIQMMDVVDDPLWEEEATRRKEYILAHGGDISDL